MSQRKPNRKPKRSGPRPVKRFMSNAHVRSTGYEYLRHLWGADLTDAEIRAKVATLPDDEREKIAGRVIANATLQAIRT